MRLQLAFAPPKVSTFSSHPPCSPHRSARTRHKITASIQPQTSYMSTQLPSDHCGTNRHDSNVSLTETALVEPTNNKKGFMFLKIGESAQYWLDSLPHSEKPLLDIGAAYGVHTIHAINAGRHVIALDCDQSHLAELRRRVESLQSNPRAEANVSLGALRGTVRATLPCSDACAADSVSGVLISEVLAFMRPGEPQVVFNDVFRWLQPGGRLVVTAASSTCLEHSVNVRGFQLANGRSLDEALQLLRASPNVLLDAAPGFLQLNKDYKFSAQLPESLYYLSTSELELMAESAGFQVERVSYISPKKYPKLPDSNRTDETVLLVARKPTE